jgi:hypothetical protein
MAGRKVYLARGGIDREQFGMDMDAGTGMKCKINSAAADGK